MTINVQIDYKQIVSVIDQMRGDEKIKLAEYLDDITWKERFLSFLESKKDIPLSIDEITDEVEIVRKKRYENSHWYKYLD